MRRTSLTSGFQPTFSCGDTFCNPF